MKRLTREGILPDKAVVAVKIASRERLPGMVATAASTVRGHTVQSACGWSIQVQFGH
jgi:hypothetical protein